MVTIDGYTFDENDVDEMAKKIDIEGGHWVFTGAKDSSYKEGVVAINDTNGRPAHIRCRRWYYGVKNRGLDKRQPVRTTCGHVYCVNPAHAEALPIREETDDYRTVRDYLLG